MYRKGSITVNVADSEAAVHLSLTLGLGRWAEHWVLGYYGLHQNVTTSGKRHVSFFSAFSTFITFFAQKK